MGLVESFKDVQQAERGTLRPFPTALHSIWGVSEVHQEMQCQPSAREVDRERGICLRTVRCIFLKRFLEEVLNSCVCMHQLRNGSACRKACRADRLHWAIFFFFWMQKDVENTWLRTAIGGEWECFLGKGSFFCGCKYIRNQYKFSKSRNTKHANKKGTLAFKGSIKCARHN